MHRVNLEKLEALCTAINCAAGTPMTPYRERDDGTFGPMANNYHLRYTADGSWGLVQMDSEPGSTSVRSIICGHMSKPELYDRMQGFLAGLKA